LAISEQKVEGTYLNIQNVKFGFELSLLIILISCYFATDYITNYISFMLLVLSFTGSPAAIAKIDID